MGRRSDHSREELKALAIAEAREVIRLEGLRAVTTRRVAAAVGYTHGTLYNIFEDLNDLIDHVNAETLDQLGAACRAAIGSEVQRSRIERLLETYLGFGMSEPLLYRALFEHRQAPLDRPPQWYSEKVDDLLAMLEAGLAAEFGPSDASTDALTLWASIHGILSLDISKKLGDRSAVELSANLLKHWSKGGLSV